MIRKNLARKFMIASLLVPLALCTSQSQAGDIGVSIHLGIPYPPPVIIAPRPVYRRPVPTFYFNETPEFIYSPSLNFYVGVGSPYDLFYHNNSYFIFQQGYWHSSNQLHGPWHIVDYRTLPPGFRRHKIEQIRRYRDSDYKASRHQRRDYPDRRYVPHYNRDYRERDRNNYREERRSREYEKEHNNYREERRPREYERERR